jgi:flagellar hook-basal body complex protein FliE
MMISAIPPISISGLVQLGNTTGVQAAAKVSPADPSAGGAFAAQIDRLTAMQQNVDHLAVQAATGDLKSIQDYTIASTEAQLMTQLTVTVRNKALEAFNDIMRMQV